MSRRSIVLITNPKRERGASALEFALTCTMVFCVIFFLIDLSLAVFHYTILQQVVSHVTREVAVNVGGATNAQAVAHDAEERTVAYLQNALGYDPGEYSFSAAVVPVGDLRYLQLNAARKHGCVVCQFLPRQLQLRTQSSVLVEDLCFKD